MPNDTSEDTQAAMTYPPKSLYDDWKLEAEEADMSASEWMQAMIEAGRKDFSTEVTPDETAAELRQQRNDMKHQLREARQRIEELENQLHQGERAEVIEFVNDNPGATYKEIVQHVARTVPNRIGELIENLEGEEIAIDGDQHYPTGGSNE